ncbi:MAG: peptidylprolyl isomerase [Anaerolineae bacterium]
MPTVLPTIESAPTPSVVVGNHTATPTAGQIQPTTGATPKLADEIDPDVVALVNGQAIYLDDYEQQVWQARAMYIDEAGLDPYSEAATQLLYQLLQQVRDWMIDLVLLQQAAVARNIQITDVQVDDEISRMRGQDSARFDAWLRANGLNEESLRQRLSSDLLTAAVRDAITAGLSHQQVHIHARYIFCTDRAAALEALARLQDGADFTEVARQYSLDETTRNNGGDLGFIPQGVMPFAFDQAAFALQRDQISELVTVDAGFIIIQVLEVDPARAVSEEHWPLVQQYAFETWLANERTHAEITYNPVFK